MRRHFWARIPLVLAPVLLMLASGCGIGGSDISVSSSSVPQGTPLVIQGTLRGQDLDTVNSYAVPAASVDIQIFDSTGGITKVYSAHVGSDGQFRYALDTSGLATGQYSVQLIVGGSELAVGYLGGSPIWHGTFTITGGG